MLLVADAVYGIDDPRLPAPTIPDNSAAGRPTLSDRAESQAFSRLPGTAEEARRIARGLPVDMIDRLEGVEATRTAVLGHPLESYRYIHFAVHGITDADFPQLSSIVLSSYDQTAKRIEDHLWAGDLLTRSFDAETIVFSACDTALGKRVAGEGLMGLRYMALARGAHSVVASLWEVPDRITAGLMSDFYTQLINQQADPASALAISMRHVIAAGPRDPALWAAFTVTTSSL
jgi:CHAT domain-containing protein